MTGVAGYVIVCVWTCDLKWFSFCGALLVLWLRCLVCLLVTFCGFGDFLIAVIILCVGVFGGICLVSGFLLCAGHLRLGEFGFVVGLLIVLLWVVLCVVVICVFVLVVVYLLFVLPILCLVLWLVTCCGCAG